MKFCSKCGSQIHDEAVICVHCGCAVNEPRNGGNNNSGVSKIENSALMAFVNEAKSIFVLGIVSIVLCLGIGIIFQIINLFKLKKFTNKQSKSLVFPEFDLTNSHEVMMYEDAKKKIKTAQVLTLIGYVISVILIAIALMSTVISMQM